MLCHFDSKVRWGGRGAGPGGQLLQRLRHGILRRAVRAEGKRNVHHPPLELNEKPRSSVCGASPGGQLLQRLRLGFSGVLFARKVST